MWNAVRRRPERPHIVGVYSGQESRFVSEVFVVVVVAWRRWGVW